MGRPLDGRRIVVTRSAEQADTLCERLEALGAQAIPFPVIQFAALPAAELDAALADAASYGWLVFTSGNAVRFFFARTGAGWRPPAGLRVAAVGSATADLLAECGVAPDFMPETFTGERLVEGLGDVGGQRVLLPRARIGRPEIVEMLRERGAAVDDIALYDTVRAEPDAAAWEALRGRMDAVTFTSPSSVRNWLGLLANAPDDLDVAALDTAAVACIGPVTADAARERGLRVDVVPAEYTIEGLVAALADYFVERSEHVA